MKSQFRNFCFVMMIAVLSGCGSLGGTKGDGSDVAVEDRSADSGAVASGAADSSGISGYALDDPNSPLSRRVIYFEYDSSEIVPEDQELLSVHANYLGDNSGASMVLEGHADERGSREYNIGLGDRRAQAVRRVLELNGVSAGQISVVSYGEEKPAAEGHSEIAWRLNRRVELVY